MSCAQPVTNETAALTLDADWVVTMAGPPIRKGRVVVEDGRVAAVGPAGEVRARGEHRRLGEAILMPGLINAHCHLELSAYHGALPPGDLWRWLGQLVMLRLRPDAAARERAAIPAAVRSMLETGTTCVGDISRSDWLPGLLEGQPIRKVCYIELISGAMSPPANMAQLRQRLGALRADDPLLTRAISPHAPYTVTREDLVACAALAAQADLPLAIHLAETVEEIEWLRRGTGRIQQWHAHLFQDPPRSPSCGATEYVLASGICRGRSALIHMNHADDWRRLAEISAQDRPAVVYCPRSHAFFDHAAHPFRGMLEAGIAVAIGTDSAASHGHDESHPLSVLEELCWLYRHQPDILPETLLRMGTVHGAAALGLADQIGRIAIGYQADLASFEMPRSDLPDPLTGLLETPLPPSFTCVAGQVTCAAHPDKTLSHNPDRIPIPPK